MIDTTGGFASLTIILRVLEGAFYGIVEACATMLVYRLFQRKSEITAAVRAAAFATSGPSQHRSFGSLC